MCCLYSLRTLFVSLLWAISFYSHVPLWQMSPPPFNNFIINYDFQDAESAQVRSRFMEQLGHGVFGPVFEADFPLNTALRNTAIRVEDHQAYHEALVDWDHGDADDDTGGAVNNNPHCFIYEPIYKTINDPKSETVGHTMAYIAWDKYIVDLLPEGVNNITVVLRNSCEQAFTYDLRGNSAYYMGPGDQHNPKYDHMEVIASFYEFGDDDLVREKGQGEACTYIACTFSRLKRLKRTTSQVHRGSWRRW
mmetsp:Transcript_3308/g.6855  ORF Transcript_3308/g.6855 Transcript_3308/m.6855 type:complete len:249 (-) Transcript_3308:42-788(-)